VFQLEIVATRQQKICYTVLAVQAISTEIEKFFATEPTHHLLVGPKVVLKPNTCSVDTPDTVAKPNNLVYVLAIGTYRDILDDRSTHVTQGCYTVNFATESVGTSDLIMLEEPCQTSPSHNCVDDECAENQSFSQPTSLCRKVLTLLHI
jgi:hypothetical protein